MKQLVAVTNDVKSARVKSLREMGGIQKSCKESKHKLPTMNELGLQQALLRTTSKQAIHDGNTVVAVRPGKGTEAEHFS